MQSHTCEVKVQDKVIGSATYVEYDNLAEALENLDESDVLKIVNRGVKLNETNKIRAKAANDTPARQIGRIARQLKKGAVNKDQAKDLIESILAGV